MERRSPDGDGRDFSAKRLKLVLHSELYNYIATASGAASVSPASTDTIAQSFSIPTVNEMVLCPVSNDGGGKRPRDSNVHSGGVDVDKSGTRNIEKVEIGMDLPEDLLRLIFSFLGNKDLCNAGATCNQWQAISMHADFWRFLDFTNTNISQQNFDAICRRYPTATGVKFLGVPNPDGLIMRALTSLRYLKTLILEDIDDIFHDSMEIVVEHDRLHELLIINCRVVRVSIRCPQLQCLSLSRTSMYRASLSCPQLRNLDISSCNNLSKSVICSEVTSCPLLASFNMSSCSHIGNGTLRHIAFACPNLCVLNASHCQKISLKSVILPMLIDLKLPHCKGITSASISAISHSRKLEALQLSYCGLLISVSLTLSHLQSISLEDCHKILDLNLDSPMLSYIYVSNCSALHHISITSKSLQKLVLQKQESLATLSLQCENLREVDLSDCESLTNSVCRDFSRGCPILNSLVLDRCESLTVVGLNSNSLVSLSLVRCRGITVLELSCPKLRKLNIDGCVHLEGASFCPVSLESLNLGICPKLSTLEIEAPKMSVLELKGCGVLSQASINCPCLTSLDASYCRKFTGDLLSTTSASCPPIESLILSWCLSVGDNGLSSFHWLNRLTLLDLSYTLLTNLQPVFDACLQLVILKLSACKNLTHSSLDAIYKEGALPALRELDLSYSSIGQSAIAVLLACTNLVNVNLTGCVDIYDLVWDSSDCHSSEMAIDVGSSNVISTEYDDETIGKPKHLLEILNCVGCPNIEKVLIAPTARCFHLSRLNLNLSSELKEVDIACFNLRSLDLSKCSSLEILSLNCPRLKTLNLLDCSKLEVEAVEAAISRCFMLETLKINSGPKIRGRWHGMPQPETHQGPPIWLACGRLSLNIESSLDL